MDNKQLDSFLYDYSRITMNNTVFYLSTCSTCKRILSELDLPEDFNRIDIKKDPLTEDQLEYLKELSGDYESLFNRRAQLYRQRNLKEKELSEEDYKELLLEHYTFLKRPVFVIDKEIYIGNSKKNVAALKKAL